ncbi:ATP-dependent zinc metalloprotease FTSH 2, chloroplastic [Orobanche minor]
MAVSSARVVGSSLSAGSTRIDLSKETYGRQFILSSRLQVWNIASKVDNTRASLDNRAKGGRRGFLKLLLGNAGLAVPSLLINERAIADEQGVPNSRMSYSRFLEYLDKDRVKKVDLFENGTIAIVEAISPELVTECKESAYSSRASARSSFRILGRRTLTLLPTMHKRTQVLF